MSDIVLCSECLQDQGLKYEASLLGKDCDSECPCCGKTTGKKLTHEQVQMLCYSFFVSGTYTRTTFGGANVLNITKDDGFFENNFLFGSSLKKDMHLLHERMGIGVCYAAPQMWRVGLISWLEDLTGRNKRKKGIALRKLISRMTPKYVGADRLFFRMRMKIADGILDAQTFDAPPIKNASTGRFNIEGVPVFYAAFDIETCIHECRATINDTLYIATVRPIQELKLLDFTEVSDNIDEETPFEDLSISTRFLFEAGEYAYHITQEIAAKVQEMGYDGIIYPSFYNQVRYKEYKNIVLFGRPIKEEKICIISINRVILKTVQYQFILGPAME